MPIPLFLLLLLALPLAAQVPVQHVSDHAHIRQVVWHQGDCWVNTAGGLLQVDLQGKVLKKYALLEGFSGDLQLYYNDYELQLIDNQQKKQYSWEGDYWLAIDPTLPLPPLPPHWFVIASGDSLFNSQQTIRLAIPLKPYEKAAIDAYSTAKEAWIGTNQGRILHWNGKQWSAVEVENPTPLPISAMPVLDGFLQDSQDRLWMSAPNGIFLCKKGQWKRFAPQDFDLGDSGELPTGLQFLETGDGAIWMVAQKGIFRYEKGFWSHLLGDERIRTAAAEPKGNLLIITEKHFLVLSPDAGIEGLDRAQFQPTAEGVYQQAIDANGHAWLLTDQLLRRFRVADGEVDEIALPTDIPRGSYILLQADPQGGLLLLANGHIERFYQNSFQHISNDPFFYCGNTLLANDQQGRIWLATSKGILVESQGVWERPISFTQPACPAIFIDTKNRLWIANGDAVSRYDIATGQMRILWQSPLFGQGSRFWEDEKGGVWLWSANKNGAVRFD